MERPRQLVVIATACALLCGRAAHAQLCGDANGSGVVTVTDGVNTLRAAAELDSACDLSTCDVDDNGRITVTDGVNVLRLAAGLEVAGDCGGGPIATPTATVAAEPTSTATVAAEPTSTATVAAEPTSTPEPEPSSTPTTAKLVFATSSVQTGGFGGIEGADSICAARASEAGLTGTFLAWVSVAGNSPSSRFAQSSSPYRLVNGTEVAASWSDLTDGTLKAGIDRDESGNPVSGDVWTGTTVAGDLASATCNDWVSSSSAVAGQCGTSGHVDGTWTAFITPSCSIQLRLYCFEQ